MPPSATTGSVAIGKRVGASWEVAKTTLTTNYDDPIAIGPRRAPRRTK